MKPDKIIQSHTFSFRGSRMHYGVIGKGTPVILLHGSMVADPWEGFEQLLSEHYQVYLPHLPGFGNSDVVPRALHTTDLFAESLQEFIREKRLERAPIIALSLGTIVALKATGSEFQNPLILVGMPMRVSGTLLRWATRLPVSLRRMLARTGWGKRNLLIPILTDIIGKADGGSNQGLLKAMEQTNVAAIVDMDAFREINGILPTLLANRTQEITYIYGAKDPLYIEAKRVIPSIETVVGGEHNVFAGKPKETLSVLLQVLKRPRSAK